MTRISTLIIKLRKGEITPEERMELDAFAGQSENNKRLVEDYSSYKHVLEEIKLSDEWRTEENWRRVEKSLPGKVLPISRYLTVAAAALIFMGFGWLLWDKQPGKKQPVAKEDNRPSESTMHTLRTGKGESKSVQLADGSSVWLNGASSIQYPNSFPGAERTMALLEGEGHFEIAKIPSRPFKLYVRNMEVEVKGTTFDISAYKNDSLVRTTLIEGKVTLKSGDDTLSLRPGEQAIWAPGKKMKKITVNSVEASARSQGWKENKFKWEKAELRTILGDIAHWHGYNLSYKTNLPSGTYYFCFDRTETLQEIFKTIQTGTRLKFKLDSATIIIYR